jgi:thioesterase III
MNWKKASYPLIIREGHLDSFGHVNNATYLQIFEEARWQFITEEGYGFREVHQRKQGPTILEVHLFFKKELKLRQQVTVESQVMDYSGKVATMVQEIRNEAGELCTRLELKFALFDTQARRLIDPTPQWLKAVGGS